MTYVWWALGALVFVSFGLIVLRGAPYVPSHRKQLRHAFKTLYPLGENDMLVDLGAGDGIVLDEARRRGARSIGYELNPILWAIMKYRFRHVPQVSVVLHDYEHIKRLPPEVTVVYAFATSLSISSIETCLLRWSQYQPLTFISYGFEVPSATLIAQDGAMRMYSYGSKA